MSDAARADWQDSNSAQNRACNVDRRVWLKNRIDPGHRAAWRDVRGFAAIGKRLKSALTCGLRIFAQRLRRQWLIALVAMLARGMATGRARVGWAKTFRLPTSWIGAEVLINNFLSLKNPRTVVLRAASRVTIKARRSRLEGRDVLTRNRLSVGLAPVFRSAMPARLAPSPNAVQ